MRCVDGVRILAVAPAASEHANTRVSSRQLPNMTAADRPVPRSMAVRGPQRAGQLAYGAQHAPRLQTCE